VIVAPDELTASDAVSCQLNQEHIHDRQPASELVSATDGQVQAADARASRRLVFDFHARCTSRWAPLAADPTRACYTDRTVMRAFPSLPVTAGLSSGSVAHRTTVEEAADRLRVGRTVMYALVSSGAVESVRIGRLRRVPADALVAFLDVLRDCQHGGAA